jgi:FkbM family methyltransferase
MTSNPPSAHPFSRFNRCEEGPIVAAGWNLSCPTRFFGELFALAICSTRSSFLRCRSISSILGTLCGDFAASGTPSRRTKWFDFRGVPGCWCIPPRALGTTFIITGFSTRSFRRQLNGCWIPGEVAVEIGANIGQSCSLMARKAGPSGRVLAFEPHPEIVEELRQNAARWSRTQYAVSQIEPVALGASPGEALLDMGPEFATNRGSATLRGNGTPASQSVKISIARLDDFLHEIHSVGVCKIDVEGHELDVLKGGSHALERRMIRDIIFEDFNPQPSAVTTLLVRYGYELFRLDANWLKPLLSAADAAQRNPPSHNYLATLDPARTLARFRPLGWRCLMYF